MSEQQNRATANTTNLPAELIKTIEDAYQSMKTFNGGYGVVSIYFKAASSPYIDVQMRHFSRRDKTKQHAS